jgi:hypothetical protein
MFDLKFYLVLCKIYKAFIRSFQDWKEMRKLSIAFNRYNGNRYQHLAEMMDCDEMTMVYFHRVTVYFDVVCSESRIR